MQMTRRSLLLGGLAVMALSGCAAPQADQLKGTTAHQQLPLTTPRVPEMAAASRDLMWSLMKLGDQTRNMVASPSSLASTLALIGLGATGPTAESLDRAFGMGAVERAAAANALRTAMSRYDSLPEKVDAKNPPETPVLHQASHLLLVDNADVAQEFLDGATQYFDTGVERVERSSAKQNLDAWVRKHTCGQIEQSAIKVTARTRLVAQDAILFAAAWQEQFDYEEPIKFHRLDGSTAPVDSVSRTFQCAHAELDGWQAIRLPYTEGFAMDIVLPPKDTSPHQADTTRLARLDQLLDEATAGQVQVRLPVLDTRTNLDLAELLARHEVDLRSFDGIFKDAEVKQVAQQARLQITAKGTVGAAVTEVGVELSAAPPSTPIDFIVDRPYLINITAEATGWSLFLAAITDPTQQE